MKIEHRPSGYQGWKDTDNLKSRFPLLSCLLLLAFGMGACGSLAGFFVLNQPAPPAPTEYLLPTHTPTATGSATPTATPTLSEWALTGTAIMEITASPTPTATLSTEEVTPEIIYIYETIEVTSPPQIIYRDSGNTQQIIVTSPPVVITAPPREIMVTLPPVVVTATRKPPKPTKTATPTPTLTETPSPTPTLEITPEITPEITIEPTPEIIGQ